MVTPPIAAVFRKKDVLTKPSINMEKGGFDFCFQNRPLAVICTKELCHPAAFIYAVSITMCIAIPAYIL